MEYRTRALVDIDAPINSLYLRSYPTEFEKYVIILEDRYFGIHSGFDIRCVQRLVRQAATGKKLGGISTIEQQLVRTVFDRRERTIKRKTKEVVLAWILNYRASKVRILRAYLSIAYFGYKLRGCDEASRLVFGRDASDLEGIEAAFLASLLVYPLPKRIQVLSVNRDYFPIGDLCNFFETPELTTDVWARQVIRRLKYGSRLLSKSKQTL